jgi:hypothetical protein
VVIDPPEPLPQDMRRRLHDEMVRLESVHIAWHDAHFKYKKLAEQALTMSGKAQRQRASIQEVLDGGVMPLPGE